jgi:hypothetical protein
MAYLTNETRALVTARSGTSASPARDALRCARLEAKHHQFMVYSMNSHTLASDCVPNRSVQTNFFHFAPSRCVAVGLRVLFLLRRRTSYFVSVSFFVTIGICTAPHGRPQKVAAPILMKRGRPDSS